MLNPIDSMVTYLSEWRTHAEMRAHLGWSVKSIYVHLNALERAHLLERRFARRRELSSGPSAYQFRVLRSNEWPASPPPGAPFHLALLMTANGRTVQQLAVLHQCNDEPVRDGLKRLGRLVETDLTRTATGVARRYNLSEGWHV